MRDVRKSAAESAISEIGAQAKCMERKNWEFAENGSELYATA